ncbi:MAG: carotenoid biosynthesis protein [Candidatus Thorarchaeota archaeon]
MAYRIHALTRDRLILYVLAAALFAASWLVANVNIGELAPLASVLFVIVMAVPAYYYLCRWTGVGRGLGMIVILGVLPLVVESIGITTGIPYGGFYYTDRMGPKLLGLVPWSVAFAYGPLVLGSFTVAARMSGDPRIAIPLSSLVLVVVDLILDPAAVVLNIWVWTEPGPYYGIPLTNYSGWFLTALVTNALLFVFLSGGARQVPSVDVRVMSSLTLAVSFWTGYAIWTLLLIPAILGVLMVVLLLSVQMSQNVCDRDRNGQYP